MSAETKPTPAPWCAIGNPRGLSFVYGADDEILTSVANPNDAYLIAAAPDLLAALKQVVAVADRRTKEFDAARAAINKAEGRS